MTTRVLLLRHAESANPAIFHGAESDVDLSERGRRQAEAVAPVLARYRPARLVCSGMLRARATAEPIAQACGLGIEIEPDLHERRVGALSGTPTGVREGVWPETLKRWIGGETGYAPSGAESFDAIRGRVLPVWERVTRDQDGRTLVIVAHGVVCKVLLLSLLPGYSVSAWKRLGPIHNVAITELVQSEAASGVSSREPGVSFGSMRSPDLSVGFLEPFSSGGTTVEQAGFGTFRLFVYGTLMRDGCRAVVLEQQRFVGPARTRPQYRLLDLGEYPGLVQWDNDGWAIEGELYEVHAGLLPVLDRVEGAPWLFRLDLVELEQPPELVLAYFYQQGNAANEVFPHRRWDNKRTINSKMTNER